jgi:hypothetical protein
MFGALMEDRIGSNVYCALIVTVEYSRFDTENMKILQQVNQPLKFTSSKRQGTILSF